MKGFNGCAASSSGGEEERGVIWDISLQGKIRFPWPAVPPTRCLNGFRCSGAGAAELPRPPSLSWGSLRALSDIPRVLGAFGSASGLSWNLLASVLPQDGHSSGITPHGPSPPAPEPSGTPAPRCSRQERMPVCE